MGHYVTFLNYPADISGKNLVREMNEYANEHDADYRDPISTVRQLAKVCDSFDAACQYLDSVAGTWYDNVACYYYEPTEVPTSAALDKANERVNTLHQKREEYRLANSVKNRKSEYIGCPKCGSKLSREYLHGNDCPLCRTSLLSDTVLKRLAKFDADISTAHDKVRAEYARAAKKVKRVKRLAVRIEYHC